MKYLFDASNGAYILIRSLLSVERRQERLVSYGHNMASFFGRKIHRTPTFANYNGALAKGGCLVQVGHFSECGR